MAKSIYRYLGLLLLFISSIFGQQYELKLNSGELYQRLNFISIEDSLLKLSSSELDYPVDERNILEFQVSTILEFNRIGPEVGFVKTKLHPIRGLATGVGLGFIGFVSGAWAGGAIGEQIGRDGEEMLLPLIVGATTGSVILGGYGLMFLNHDYVEKREMNDLSGLNICQKIEIIQSVVSQE